MDAGVYEHNAGPLRAYSRSTSSHNTVTVGDQDQCEFWSAFRVARRARVHCHYVQVRLEKLELEGSHDGYQRLDGSPRHRRKFAVTPERIQVRDVVEGGAGQAVRARLCCIRTARSSRRKGKFGSRGKGSCWRPSEARIR